MRKLFILCSAFFLLGTLGLGQFSGEWTTLIRVVPSVGLEKCDLTLKYAVDTNWTISSVSKFDETGLIDQSFGFSGTFGPFALTGGMSFNPTVVDTVEVFYPEICGDPQTISYTLTAPAYKEAWVKAAFTLAGLELGTEFHHWAYPYHQEDIDDDDELEYYWPCCLPQTQSYTLITFFAKLPPFALEINLADCCTGLSFSEALLSLTNVGLCCGLTYDAEVYFTKAGFGYFEVALEFSICCGISIEVATRFTVDHKQVTVTPKWNGMGQACFVIYGDIVTGNSLLEIAGLEIYGYKLRCDFSSCSYIELMTAFDVKKLEDLLDEDIFEEGEFEYWKLAFCGPGCCGSSMYSLSLAAFFQPEGSLFGLTRIQGDLSVPIMANFDLLLSLSVSLGGGTELAIGWTFRF